MSFFFPRLNRYYLLRLACIALVSLLFFGFICRPCIIKGGSMLPTYSERGFTFCWCPAFYFSQPQRGQVVIVRLIGRKVLLLKRVVALAGDTVAFSRGQLLVNGKPFVGDWQEEGPCDWELPERIVEPGHVYVVGDNRTMSMEEHIFGQVPESRVIGVPVW